MVAGGTLTVALGEPPEDRWRAKPVRADNWLSPLSFLCARRPEAQLVCGKSRRCASRVDQP